MKLTRPQFRRPGAYGLNALACILVGTLVACGAGDDAAVDTVARRALAPAPDNRSIGFLDTGIGSSQCYQLGNSTLVSCSSPAALALHDWQDGMVGRDVTSPDNADGMLGFSYSEWNKPGGGKYARTECVKDNVTGLVWEGKPTSGARSATDTYDNLSGAGAYVSAVNAAGLCGFSDWRLPTRYELHTLVNFGWMAVLGEQATVDSDWFPNTQALGSYMTSTPYVGKVNQIWRVGFGNGDISKHPEPNNTYVSYVRLVRGPQQTMPQYILSADGTEVTDPNTKLIWSRCSMGQVWGGTNCLDKPSPVNQEQAFLYARSIKGWRLPNVRELSSLVDARRESPAIETGAFPSTPQGCFWSSTPVNGGSPVGNKAWTVDFNIGSVDAVYDRNGGDSCYARLVRSAP